MSMSWMNSKILLGVGISVIAILVGVYMGLIINGESNSDALHPTTSIEHVKEQLTDVGIPFIAVEYDETDKQVVIVMEHKKYEENVPFFDQLDTPHKIKSKMTQFVEPGLERKITGDTAKNVCLALEISCTDEPVFESIYDRDTGVKSFSYWKGDVEYTFNIKNNEIKYRVEKAPYEWVTFENIYDNPVHQGMSKPEIHLDSDTYTWTDMVYITIVAPSYNRNSEQIEEIGNSDDARINIATRGMTLDNYQLTETGIDTGIFSGDVMLVGFPHDADGNPRTGENGNDITGEGQSGIGPYDGLLPSDDDDGITVSFETSDGEVTRSSALIRWNIGEIMWLESEYFGGGTAVIRVTDPDMNWNSKVIDNFDVDVWSDSDVTGVDLTVTETSDNTGIFEGTIFFTSHDESSGHRLRVSDGDTLTARYEDHTLPNPYSTADELGIVDTASIHEIDTLVDPIENRITLDKKEYSWTDTVHITINAPDHNLDDNTIDEIGNSKEHPIKVATRDFDLDNYKLVETGPNTGIFAGKVTLTGNQYHDANGDGNDADASGIFTSHDESLGPDNGFLPIYGREGITVSFEFEEDKVAVASAPILWSIGLVQWLESDYYVGNVGRIMVIDYDINLNQEERDSILIDVWSDSDAGGIDLLLTETDVATGMFQGFVEFVSEESSDSKLQVAKGDRVWAEYEDNTLPEPHTTADELDVTAETMIEK